MIVVLAFGHGRGAVDDGLGDIAVEQLQVAVHVGRTRLDQAQGVDHRARRTQIRDRKIVDRTLRLRAPERIGGHLEFAHAVFFDPVIVICGHRVLLRFQGLAAGRGPDRDEIAHA